MSASKKSVTESFARAVGKLSHSPTYSGHKPYEAIRDTADIGWLHLSIDVPADTIMRELEQAKHLFVPHRDGYESQGWNSFCLHGRGLHETREDSHYTDSVKMDWVPQAQELMPETIEWLKTQWPHGSYQRVRMMELEPGGWIGVHKDTDIKQLGPINIAITQPADCEFYSEGLGVVPFRPATAMWMDVSRRHAVINRSSQPRWHMIIHQTVSADWQRLVELSYANLEKPLEYQS